MPHTVLTFIAKVAPGKVRQLKEFLAEIEKNPRDNPHVPFGSLKKLHFASMVIFPDDHFGPYLVFENNFDGPLEPYLNDLYEYAAAGLHRIYGHCLDYRVAGANDRAGMIAYLRAHVVRPAAYHIGNTGRTAEQIKHEADLRSGLETFLDGVARKGGAKASPVNLRRQIQEFVKSNPAWSWAAHVRPRMTFIERYGPWAKLGGLVLLTLFLLPVVLPLLIIFVIVLRHREKTDPSVIGLPSPEHVRELAGREDNIVQNHMANMSTVKPGLFRGMTIKAVLGLTNLVARVSTNGKLSGLDSLHFAHWALIDDGKRLLFLTNYDGSWENYLDDFIDKSSIGLTGIWSNTVNFPRTRFLVFGGAQDGPRFKAISRTNQVYTNVWYSAYEDLTVKTIDNNSSIHEDLWQSLDETATRRWLWRF